MALALALLGLCSPSLAQDRIWRCGNEYTNNPSEAQRPNCQLVSGGNVTVVPAQRSVPTQPAQPASISARISSPEQRQRDSDARRILEEELRKAEARREELRREYNEGQPERMGPETRNYQKYLDRVANLKANLERVDSDIAGLQRELGRLPASK